MDLNNISSNFVLTYWFRPAVYPRPAVYSRDVSGLWSYGGGRQWHLTEQLTMHFEHGTLHNANYTPHTVQFILHTEHLTMHTEHCTPHTEH